MAHPPKPPLRSLRRPFNDQQYPVTITQAYGNIASFEPATFDFGDGVIGWIWEPGCTEDNIHGGVDYALDGGVPLLAVANGTVKSCTPPQASYGLGNLTIVDHGDRLLSLYAHQSRFGCTPGQTVKSGEVMGYVGTTGNSSGNHLHFALGMDDLNGWYCHFSPVPYLNTPPPPATGYPTAGRYRVLTEMFLRTQPAKDAPHGRLVRVGDVLVASGGWTTSWREVDGGAAWAFAPNLAKAG